MVTRVLTIEMLPTCTSCHHMIFYYNTSSLRYILCLLRVKGQSYLNVIQSVYIITRSQPAFNLLSRVKIVEEFIRYIELFTSNKMKIDIEKRIQTNK